MKRSVKTVIFAGAVLLLLAVTALIIVYSLSDGWTAHKADITEATTLYEETETSRLIKKTAQTKTETQTETKTETTAVPKTTAKPETTTKTETTTAQPIPSPLKSFTRTQSYADSVRMMDEYERTFEDDFCLEIEEICKRFSAVGLSLVIFKDGEELYSQVYGMADVEKGIPVDENTKFRVASMSKFATGILIMKLVSEGKADLDADISDYTGVKIRSPYYKDVMITPRMLMNHSSSIVDGDWAFTKGAPLSEMFKPGSTSYFSTYRPGSTYIYSNFGASLLTCLIEKASGQHFVNYSQSALISPLGLNAAYSITQIKDRESIAQMYVNGKLYKDQKMKSATTAGCLNTPLGKYFQLSFVNLMISTRDMALLAMVLAGDGTFEGVRVLPKETVDVMNQKVEGSGSPWGLMQKIVVDKLVKGRTLHGHNGEAYGYIGCVYYDREDKTGFVYMTNGCRHSGGEHTYAITEAVARAVYGDYISHVR